MDCDHVKALELIRAGEWETAHNMVQPFSDELSCLIHAYLHRVEGDMGNAAYWYRCAGTKIPDTSLQEELEHIFQLADRHRAG